MKSGSKLESFTTYCQANPDQSFCEALKGWSGYKRLYGQESGKLVTTAITKEGKVVTLKSL